MEQRKKRDCSDVCPERSDHLVEDRGLLRFLTCGSVDDGKSTLIGRLLFDTKTILADAPTAIGGPRKQARPPARSTCRCSPTACRPSANRASPSTSPTALLLHRHAQVHHRRRAGPRAVPTRNMVTAASTANLAIIPSTRAGRADPDPPPLQARCAGRHPHLVVAINKMDLVGYSTGNLQERSGPTTSEFAAKVGIGTCASSRFRRSTAT